MLTSPTQPVITELPGIVIPEDATIASLRRAGMYDRLKADAWEEINDENFAVTVTGPRSLSLAEFTESVTTRQVEEVIEKMGYKLALVEDLLAVGAHPEYRNLQLEFFITALGSRSSYYDDNPPFVPLLFSLEEERLLGETSAFDTEEWDDIVDRFLLVDENA